MNNQETWKKLSLIVNDYVQMVHDELSDRWDKWTLDLAKIEMHEVVGGLLARQVTLATQLACAPSIWNGHIAPLILRTMTDTYITLAWILGDPLDRSRKFILHGLGQEKLEIEQLKAQLEASADDSNNNQLLQMIQIRESWLNSQRFSFLTEVDIGSWSGISTRKMAEEAGCLDLYRFAYTPFSGATHSMWHHIGKYNLNNCKNPLHRYHRVPVDLPLAIDPDYLYRAAKYVEKAFNLFDEKTAIKPNATSAFDTLVSSFEQLSKLNSQDLRVDDLDAENENI